eukprot:CAMPEP_0116912778 /NCGR_PEP_ID=MMETSP0467-20121206/16296_1 /TAXON_ID=283647 /ORGANISM="Mesodinium pulex, Strain SPMC105" /LENGTH=71 /DNA_ID=CAMNT_0004588837 /DNA_START=247 /DNA_END=462 /DNA_ORIENTATION=+
MDMFYNGRLLERNRTFQDQNIIQGNVELEYQFVQEMTTTKEYSLYETDVNGPLLRISKTFTNLFNKDNMDD